MSVPNAEADALLAALLEDLDQNEPIDELTGRPWPAQEEVEAWHCAVREFQREHIRTVRAWRRLGSFAAIQDEPEPRQSYLYRWYAIRLVLLARHLRRGYLLAQLAELTPGPVAKTRAAGTLRLAATSGVDHLVTALRRFATRQDCSAVDYWLHDETGLMREVLSPAEVCRPDGWAGPFSRGVCTPEGFRGWLDQQMVMLGMMQGIGTAPACPGAAVKNAYLLAKVLGLTGLPPQPPGTPALDEELAVLREIRASLDPTPPAPSPETRVVDKGETSTRPDRRMQKAEWLAKALLLRQQHPDWPDNKIAKEVGRDPAVLCREPTYREATKLARGKKQDRHKGHIETDAETGARRGVEGYSRSGDDPAKMDWDD